MSILAKYLGVKAVDLHDLVVKAVASADPAGLSAAQIEEYKKNVDELAAIAAKAIGEAQADQNKVNELTAAYEKYKRAAVAQDAVIDSTTDADAKTKAQAVFDQLADKAKSFKADLAVAQSTLTDSLAYAEERKSAHAEMVKTLTSAKNLLEQAQRNQQRAHEQADRAEQRKVEMEKAQGLTHGLDGMNAALSAMNANADADRQRAEAAKLTTNALGGASETDKAVQAALAAVDNPVSAAKDNKSRLADL